MPSVAVLVVPSPQAIVVLASTKSDGVLVVVLPSVKVATARVNGTFVSWGGIDAAGPGVNGASVTVTDALSTWRC